MRLEGKQIGEEESGRGRQWRVREYSRIYTTTITTATYDSSRLRWCSSSNMVGIG